FPKVIDGMRLEGSLHVLGMRGGEDHLRYPIVTEHLEDAYAIELGHLHVEEDEVGGELFDGSDRLAPFSHSPTTSTSAWSARSSRTRSRPSDSSSTISTWIGLDMGCLLRAVLLAPDKGNGDPHHRTPAGSILQSERMVSAVQL